MPIDLYMVITDQNGVVLAGESTTSVYDPYTRKTVTKPVEVFSVNGETEQTYTIGSSTGGGSGKVVFDPFTVTRRVDVLTPTLFLTEAQGLLLKYVDLLFVQTNGGDPGTTGFKPFLSYRLGTVGITDLKIESGDESPAETVSFDYGQLQIGYQVIKPDGTLGTFAPVGWDRVRNIKI